MSPAHNGSSSVSSLQPDPPEPSHTPPQRKRPSYEISSGFDSGHDPPNGESSGSASQRSRESSPREHALPEHYGGTDTLQDTEYSSGRLGARSAGTMNRRHGARNHGGFLLPDQHLQAPESERMRREGKDPRPHGEILEKSNHEGGLFVSKKRSSIRGHRKEKSIGSSPLATNVTQANDDTSNAKPRKHRGSISESWANGSALHPDPGSRSMDNGNTTPALGFGTDPAQIVNLALNLGESRKRFASAGRVVSGSPVRSVVPDRQVGARQGGALRQHLLDQRRVSRNISPVNNERGKNSPTRLSRANDAARSTSHSTLNAVATPDDLDVDGELYLNASDATLVRVEKAKNFFETQYEYRRLLSNLPPLRARKKSSAGARLVEDTSTSGRSYNPLQYIRNRKVRYREKEPINSEAEGWTDVEKVREWVNVVADSCNEPKDNPNNCVRLPQLRDRLDVSNTETSPSDPPQTLGNEGMLVPTKPKRPRMDWETKPADMLADAFWLEQGLNKALIEDKDGNKLYPRDTRFNFVGWRGSEREQVHEEDLPKRSAEDQGEAEEALEPRQQLPAFASTERDDNTHRKRSKILHDPIAVRHSEEGSRERKSRWRPHWTRSGSTSSSSAADEEKSRGRKEAKRKAPNGDRHAISTAALEKQMLEAMERDKRKPLTQNAASTPERQIISKDTLDSHRRTSEDPNEERPTVFTDREALTYSPSPDRPFKSANHSPKGSPRSSRRPARLSLDQPSRPRTSLDSTAPNTPAVPGFIPSISINLSPPASRSPSPTKSRKLLPTQFLPFSHNRNKSKHRSETETNDFAPDSLAASSRQVSSEVESRDSLEKRRDGTASPKSRILQENLVQSPAELSRANSTKLSKHGNVSENKLRGIFKGGRIAELVGNEVSRVGDFIWKRDAPLNDSRPSTAGSTASEHSAGDLDTDTDNPPQRTRTRLKRFRTSTDEDMLDRYPTNPEPPRYYMTNLPTFKSPFQKEERADTSPDLSDADPISRQVSEQRQRGRSGRFERLAPPRIDVNGLSPSSAPSPDSRRGSNFSESQRLGLPGEARDIRKPLVTGLTALDATRAASRSPHRRPSGSDVQRHWSISSRSVSTNRSSIITNRDIARVRALLLSSGVKAQEINRRANGTQKDTYYPEPYPQRFWDVFTQCNALRQEGEPEFDIETLARVPKKELHVLAARLLIHTIDSHTAAFQTAATTFTNETLSPLYAKLSDLQKLVNDDLTPRVRTAGDDAGEFSAELTTTHTLAVKRLGEKIEGLARRRRRRSRWVRRLAFGGLEWVVLGVLWVVWFVVVCLRVVRGLVRGIVAVGKWILWWD